MHSKSGGTCIHRHPHRQERGSLHTRVDPGGQEAWLPNGNVSYSKQEASHMERH